MSEIAVAPAAGDEVRAIQRRRGCDDAAIRLSLEFTERGTVFAARDGGAVVGIAVAHATGEERYVGDLFVEPSYRNQGVGRSLLQSALAGADDVARAVVVNAQDPASLALALRFGLAPREEVSRFAGAVPREEELAAMAAGHYRFEVAAIDPIAHALGLRELDRQTRGAARFDHFELARSGAGTAFFLNGEFVAYAYVWPDGRIGPLASASQAYLVQIFAFALLALTRQHGASWCVALVPGSNLRVARAALRAGLRIQDSVLLAGDAFGPDTQACIGYHTLLF